MSKYHKYLKDWRTERSENLDGAGWEIVHPDGIVIAEVIGFGDGDPVDEQIALIMATAPDLLEACKIALEHIEGRGDAKFSTRLPETVATILRQAIAKAEPAQ